MDTAAPPPNEQSRLRALAALDLVGGETDAALEALAALASTLIGAPTGFITLLNADRQYVAGTNGDRAFTTHRDIAFCDHTIRQAEPMVVDDAEADPRFAANPLVTGLPGLRFYAGMAVRAPDPLTGQMQPIGAICAVDTVPHTVNREKRLLLRRLALVAEGLILARAASRTATDLARQADAQAADLQRKDRTFRQAERMTQIGAWRLDLATQTVEWSDGIYRIYEVPLGDGVPLTNALEHFPAHVRQMVSDSLDAVVATGMPFDYETDFVTATGRERRVRSVGELETRDGAPCAVVGVFQDITERHVIEERLRRSASTDALTGIANRATFDATLQLAMDSAAVDRTPLALALIDVDWFKSINDSHGHLAGDDVLRALARRLAKMGGDCVPARIGGDEFAVVLRGFSDDALDAAIHALVDALQRPVVSEGVTIPVSGTIGYARYDAAVESSRDFIHRADLALYRAKQTRRGSCQRFGALRSADRRAA